MKRASQKELKGIIKNIVKEARALKNKYTDQSGAVVSYVAIFCQNQEEYRTFSEIIRSFGIVINETATGFHYKIPPLMTCAGRLKIVKIRKPDKTRPERGDADFNVMSFADFKEKYIGHPGFKLIVRKDHEMVELMETGANVRVYFSNPHIDTILGVK